MSKYSIRQLGSRYRPIDERKPTLFVGTGVLALTSRRHSDLYEQVTKMRYRRRW